MTSNLNNAATMSIDDYFTLNAYKGKIYKTTNMLGKTLAQTVGNDSVKLSKEQLRIEKEITDFEKNIWGNQARKDSLDSIAKLDPKQQRALHKQNRRRGVKTVRAARTKTSQGSSASSSGAARITVRRQRH